MKRRPVITLVSTLLVSGLLVMSLLTGVVLAYPYQTNDTEVADALNYLDGSIDGFGPSAWVVMAIAAAGESPNTSIVDYLADNADNATIATDYARMLLAIAAADEDPYNFGGRNFVYLLEETYDGTQIGDNTLLNDDFWGVLALIAVGKSPSLEIITDSVAFILDNQSGDGGWSWGVGGDSDVDDTAAAIMALIAAGESGSSSAITNGLAYIKSTQMDNGGFESWGATNSATDSWAINAIVAAGQDPTTVGWTSGSGNTAVDDLLSFQNPDGSFYWQSDAPGMSIAQTTAYAITALVGEPFPTAVLSLEAEEEVYVRIEGESDTIWSGTVTVCESSIKATDSGDIHHLDNPTALGALDEASKAEGFPYETSDAWGTPYVTSINGEVAAGLSGWLYRVDYYSPLVGAGDFILDETTPPDPSHQEVLWYYGEWGEPPLKITGDRTKVYVGEGFIATVTQYSDDTNTWSPCQGATIHADEDYITSADGTIGISIGSTGTFNIYAEKEGSTRSDVITISVVRRSGGGGGGGGISGGLSPGTTDVSDIVASDGVFTEGITAQSEDENCVLTIDADTKGLIEDEEPLDEITLIEMEDPPDPPEESNVIGLTYDFGPDGASFDPSITLAFTYDPSLIPEGVNEENLVIAMWDKTTGEWVVLEGCTVDLDSHTISAPVSHFTAFSILAYTRPAAFTVSSLTITPGEVDIGESAAISVLITNTGDLTGSYEVSLEINNTVVETKEVTLAGGDSEPVSFSITKDTAGEYTVNVGGLLGTFEVRTPQAAFSTSDLSVSPAEIQVGENVNISVSVANTGDITGTYGVTLEINNVVVETREVTLASGDSKMIAFTTTEDTVGTYTANIDGLSDSFMVKEAAPPALSPQSSAKPINWPILSGVIAGVIIVGLLIFFVARRTYY